MSSNSPSAALGLAVTGSKVTPRGQIDVTGSLSGERTIRKPGVKDTSNTGSARAKPEVDSTFKIFYNRGDLPVTLDNTTMGNTVHWRGFNFQEVDYHHYLPIFFDGLRETKDPYKTIARRGIKDLLEQGGQKVKAVIPQLIIPIKTALETKDPEIICATLVALQQLVLSADGVGMALVPYYRQILPTFNQFKNRNVNLGDSIDYSQQKKQNVGDLVNETLSMLELYGGEDAYINIKYMVPTYESCVHL